jgi:hypothetical protein
MINSFGCGSKSIGRLTTRIAGVILVYIFGSKFEGIRNVLKVDLRTMENLKNQKTKAVLGGQNKGQPEKGSLPYSETKSILSYRKTS